MSPASDSSAKPLILFISIELESFFDDTYADLISRISAQAKLQRAKSAAPAVRVLTEDPAPRAVLITDAALTRPENSHVWDAVLSYVRTGGTAICMGHFSGFVKPKNVKPFFAKADLRWDGGSYHRTTLHLNRAAVGDDTLSARLPASYSQKALAMANVGRSAAWYLADATSMTESHVFPAEAVGTETDESAVAFAPVGQGKLGYLGDVNAEKESDEVILAMCGL